MCCHLIAPQISPMAFAIPKSPILMFPRPRRKEIGRISKCAQNAEFWTTFGQEEISRLQISMKDVKIMDVFEGKDGLAMFQVLTDPKNTLSKHHCRWGGLSKPSYNLILRKDLRRRPGMQIHRPNIRQTYEFPHISCLALLILPARSPPSQ